MNKVVIIVDSTCDLPKEVVEEKGVVIVPLTVSGIISGIVMVFVPALTSFAVSELLGGGKVLLIGNIIEESFISTVQRSQV